MLFRSVSQSRYIGTAAGAIAGGIIGLGQTIGGWLSGKDKEKKQREHEKEMMGLQYQYKETAANNNMTRALEMWRKTGYEAQGQQIENAGTEQEPLGTLAGRGVTTQQRGDGEIYMKISEPSYIIGVVAITPMIDYSQGNDWDMTNIKNMDDFHNPLLMELDSRIV